MVSIVLLNFNGRNHLQTFLPSVVQYSDLPNVEIWLIDNASQDNSVAFVEAEYPQIKVVRLDKNYGFAGGYNQGLKEIPADYFVLLNTDVEVTENWLSPVVEYLDNNKDVAACQPKILSYNEKSMFEHAGAAGGFIDYLGYPFCRGRIINTVEKDCGQYNNVIDVFWATGACLFIRSEVFFEVGGFDDKFFAHMEEIDLCWRLKARGKRIACMPQSVVYHLGGGTLNKENPHKTYLNYRNNLLMLYKNMPAKALKKALLMRFLMDYASAFLMLISGKPHDAKAVIRARIDFKKMKKEYKTQRKENLEASTMPVHEEICRKSLVFNYYLRKKKVFSDYISEE